MVDAVTTPTRAQIAALVGNDQRLILAMEQLFIASQDVQTILVDIATIQSDITTLINQVSNVEDDIDAQALLIAANTSAIADINAQTFGSLYTVANATATTFGAVNTPAKVLGTTTAGVLTAFAHSNNRLTYSGATRTFKVTASLNYTGTTAETFAFYIAQNGTVIASSEISSATGAGTSREGVNVQALAVLNSGDFVEVWAENTTSANSITVTDLQLVASNV